MTTLLAATHQWSSRPADERYPSIEAMHMAAVDTQRTAVVGRTKTRDLRVVESDGDVVLLGKTGAKATLNNWSFGQLCKHAKAPAGYLGTLPSNLVVDCLNTSLATPDEDDEHDSVVLFDKSKPVLAARGIVSDKYTRIWYADVTKRLVQLKQSGGGWNEAPAAFDGSRGQYLGDRDMFSFFVDNDRRIFETDKNGGLGRGFFVGNSEVGSSAFWIMTFLYEYVCGNHRVWGASKVSELRIRHVGNADKRGISEWNAALREYASASASDDEAKIVAAKNFSFGATKDEVLDAIFKIRGVSQVVSQKQLALSYAKAEEHADWYGSPRTAWGFAGGMTELARDLPNANDRVAVDRAAAKVMEVAF